MKVNYYCQSISNPTLPIQEQYNIPDQLQEYAEKESSF